MNPARRELNSVRRTSIRQRRVRPLGLVVALGVLCTLLGVRSAAGAAEPKSHVARSISRCGFTNSPYGRIGIYVMKGKVRCRSAEFVVHRAFYVSGTPINGAGSSALYADGWICGGQMGYYTCTSPTVSNPSTAVEGIACHFGSVTCPPTTPVVDLPGPTPTAPVDIAKCVPANYLLVGSSHGVARAALRQSPTFQVLVAARASSSDLNFQTLAATCSRKMVLRTWYTDLHPRGMQCGACDSHEYWVRLRSGVWATLGSFSG